METRPDIAYSEIQRRTCTTSRIHQKNQKTQTTQQKKSTKSKFKQTFVGGIFVVGVAIAAVLLVVGVVVIIAVVCCTHPL